MFLQGFVQIEHPLHRRVESGQVFIRHHHQGELVRRVVEELFNDGRLIGKPPLEFP
jgi:hypothetical protein